MILGTGILIALTVSVASEGYQVQPDRMIEASAAARAAEKVGDIRGSISFDEVSEKTEVKPKPTPVVAPPPATPEPKIQPITENLDGPGIDRMPTGSIQKNVPSTSPMQWQIFDSEGKPVYR